MTSLREAIEKGDMAAAHILFSVARPPSRDDWVRSLPPVTEVECIPCLKTFPVGSKHRCRA